ncbi:Acetyltransferase (GNAT) family protein [Muriicola jejuensis]|uniref:GNAT family N-acetyltransferase n=1 Tax=Muriicola jejuensis TaxID=504488 RepID=A0A6P0UD09_9FLAO|nr:GNAT family N-acetyltransferase [Muriicola jejuensis]NER11144.1 GNAT family N-acetyltransferase [Muriicola jejuensis]SMP24054.1 Acetyltransferase (GNAT) family protein [Muriicola jejuensis]
MKQTGPIQVDIIDFSPDLAFEFREMNLSWLERYFYVEPKDEDLLNRAEEVIIDQGGKIFFGKVKGEIAGCFSLLPGEDMCFELGKMAVKPQFQGQQIGQKLLRFAIDYTRERGMHRLYLYSNTILTPAIHLYRKFGFVEIEMEDPPPYARSNIKMALNL